MVKLSLTISFLLGFSLCNAQIHSELNKDTSYFQRSPLYVLQLPLSDPFEGTGIFVKSADIDTVSVFKDSLTIATYGEKAANGVIIFKTRRFLKIITFEQLLTSYKITDSNLPVFIDSAIAYKPRKNYFDPKAVKSVSIEKDSVTGTNYISILSYEPIRRLKPGDISIRGNVYDIKVNR
jgi:hypothetical protein